MAAATTRRLTRILLAAVAIGAAPAGAQDTPSEIAAAFFKAVAGERWLDAARHLDVAALDRYRREQIAAARLRPHRPPRVITVEELLQQDPDMPRAVAEYQARKANERIREPSGWFEHEFAVTSLDSLAALSPEEAAARWLQARDLRWRTRRAVEQMRARGCRLPAAADEPLPAPSQRILAAAVVDSTTAYVLFDHGRFVRADPDLDAALHSDGPHLLTLRRRGERWRILPRHEMAHGPVVIDYIVDCPPNLRRPG
jgi:hypothetical protein